MKSVRNLFALTACALAMASASATPPKPDHGKPAGPTYNNGVGFGATVNPVNTVTVKPINTINAQTRAKAQAAAKASALSASMSAASGGAGGHASNAGMVSNSGNVTVEASRQRIPVATAYAAGLAASDGTCLGSASAGVQGSAIGLSIGGTKQDEDCNIRRDAAVLMAAGLDDVAVRRLCDNPAIREAMTDTGRSCAQGGLQVRKPAHAVAVPLPVMGYAPVAAPGVYVAPPAAQYLTQPQADRN